jgi:hypothetical protein
MVKVWLSNEGHSMNLNNPYANINLASERDQLKAVTKNGFVIEYIKNPSEAVQIAAINKAKYVIAYINNPTQDVIKIALTNQELIDNHAYYERVIKRLFADNVLLMKKWIRYGEVMRISQ